MSLIVPAWGFTNYVDSIDITAPWPPGALVTADTTAHTNGAAVDLLSALAFDVHLIEIVIQGWTTNGQARSTLLDILVDPAGGTSWSELIADIGIGQQSGPVTMAFPLWIPAGSSIGARVQSGTTSSSGRIAVRCYGDPLRPEMWWCGSAVETLGATPASSSGTAVTPGNAAWGSWTTIGASTRDYGALQVGHNGPQTGAAQARTAVWQVGVGGAVLPIGEITENQTNTEQRTETRGGVHFVHIPSGSSIQMRGSAVTNQQDAHFTLHGVY